VTHVDPDPKPRLGRRGWITIAVVLVLALVAVLVAVFTRGGGEQGTPTPAPAPTTAPTTTITPSAGTATSAAAIHNWGEPNRVDEFDEQPGSANGWTIYNGAGHVGNGRRIPQAFSVKDGILTVTGDGDGNTGGMAWNPGQKYGRWEGRVRAPASDPTYHALLLMWPDAEDWPKGGELDFMEMLDPDRQAVEGYVHYGKDNSQDHAETPVDATQWHNWAVEWTPDHLIYYLDGQEWYRTDDPAKIPPRAMHLAIQLDWFPEDGDRNNVQPSTMEVDWVKQYPLT
jgi:beta-glucanase (GH16 family)